jgi:hypothetical protein
MQRKTLDWTNKERTKSAANSRDNPTKRNVIPGHSNKSSATWNTPASDEDGGDHHEEEDSKLSLVKSSAARISSDATQEVVVQEENT